MDTTQELEARTAVESDIPFLMSLRRNTMDEHLLASGADISDDAHRSRIAHGFECAQVLELAGQPVGLLKLRRGAAEWEIIQFQLCPSIQCLGYGRAVLESVLSEADTIGARVVLSVLKANPAKRLYERLGFVVTGETPHEYVMSRAA